MKFSNTLVIAALAACISFGCGESPADDIAPIDGVDGRTPAGDVASTGTPGAARSDGPQSATPDADDAHDAAASTSVSRCNDTAKARRSARVLRRLTTPQIEATVRAVFGLDVAAWAGPSLPPDPAAKNGFNNNAERLQVNDTFAQRFQTMADAIAELVSAAPHLDRLSDCAPVGDTACAERYLDTVGRRLYRRSLTAEEKAPYLALHAEIMAEDAFSVWIKWATVGLLQSPHVLYRAEMGIRGDDGLYRLTGVEMASALAYGLTGAPPSLALIEQAEAGQLETVDQRREVAQAMAFDADRPSGTISGHLVDFTANWLGVVGLQNRVRDGEMFPDFDGAVKTSMQREFDTFIHHVLVEQGASTSLLFSAPYTFVDDTLSAFYGYGDAAGEEMVKVDRPADWGVGILSLGAFQTAHAHGDSTSPTKRGYMVRERILCNPIGPPPAEIPDIAPPSESTTTRQRYEELHAAAPECAGCHQLMDQIGFGFEHLDATGRFRADENGHEIDDTGSIVGYYAVEDTQAFHGATALGDALANGEEAAHCFTTYFASYTYGLDEDQTRCLADDLATQFHTGEITAAQLTVELLVSEAFTVRKESDDAGDTDAGSAPETNPETETEADTADELAPEAEEEDAPEPAPEDATVPDLTPEVTVETAVQSEHDGGYCMNATVTNTGETDVTWAVDIAVEGTVTTVWEARGYSDAGTIRFGGHEARTMTLAAGASHTFGWCATLR